MEKNELLIDSIVPYSNGKHIMMACKINKEPVEVIKGDLVECFLVVKNEHSAKGGLKLQFLGMRLVCDNGMTVPEELGSISFRHSKTLESKMSELQGFLDIEKKNFLYRN
nr:DUF932 domain-containing protein [Okeania sp. SIO3I5]